MIAVIIAVVVIAVAGGICAKTLRKKNSIAAQGTTLSAETISETEEEKGFSDYGISSVSETAQTVIESLTEKITETKNSFFGKKGKETTTGKTEKPTKETVTGTTVLPSATNSSTTATTTTTKPAESKTTTTTKKQTTADSNTYAYSYAGFNPKPADMAVTDWTLILVNRDYILPEGFTPANLANSVKSDPDSKKLDSRVAPYYNEMYLAAKKDGIDLYPLSGYRSYTLQKNNFSNKIQYYRDQGYNKTEATKKAATIILPPGTSEHNLGFAMDICSLEESFENTKEFRWLMNHADDYGFILRYPKDKEDVTKIIYEPWHWRYVGVDNAKKIKASGLCLEEYLGKTN